MRKVILIIVFTAFYSICFSQIKYAGNGEYHFEVNLTSDSVSARYANDSVGPNYRYVILPVTNTAELDQFIKNNISDISKKKVIFATFHKVGLDSLMAVKNILGKYKIYIYDKFMVE